MIKLREMDTILVIAAHPDDEVLGCGGTIAQLTDKGHNVYVAILGEGITSRDEGHDKTNESALEELHAQTQNVGSYLSAKEVVQYKLPDNRFDTIALLDIVKLIEALIIRLSPKVIYTHHNGDLNVDHQITHQAVLTATRPVKDCPVKDIYTFEVPSSTEWAFVQSEPVFRPNVFVDISGALKRKIEALQLYKSEVRPFPHPRSAEALSAIAHTWGSKVGLEAAEAFQLIRSIR